MKVGKFIPGQKYKGHAITFVCGHYGALGKFFKTLKAAKIEIDKLYTICE